MEEIKEESCLRVGGVAIKDPEALKQMNHVELMRGVLQNQSVLMAYERWQKMRDEAIKKLPEILDHCFFEVNFGEEGWDDLNDWFTDLHGAADKRDHPLYVKVFLKEFGAQYLASSKRKQNNPGPLAKIIQMFKS